MDYGTPGNDISADQYLMVQTFQNSIGNINTPNYLKFKGSSRLSDSYKSIQLGMIWIVWFLNQYVILVIMLNFLIAVISDTYTREQQLEKMHTYAYRNALNIEYLQIRKFFYKLRSFTCVLYITDQEAYQNKSQET